MPNKAKPPVVYAFIDSQNLNLGVRSTGWQIDYKKFRLYLKNKYSVDQAFMFIGLVANNQKLYTTLQAAGFILVFKPTVRYFENGKETVKGNVDAELVLHASAIEFANYDKAIIVSGDGDFACLLEFLDDKDKLLHVFTPNKTYSKLLRPYSKYIVELSRLKKTLEYKKTGIGGRSKP
ncbi:MAG: NYN domain-containing protein [Patescibacteria group bacterium]